MEDFESVDVLDIRLIQDQMYEVDMKELIEIVSSTNSENQEYCWTYTVERVGDFYHISKLR